MNRERGNWSSKIGFILAASGSAIGLGNIWRFPYIAGQNGGAAFVLLYVMIVILLGLPVMISELAIGRNTQKNPVGAFQKLFPQSAWKWVGWLGIITGIGILSFYSIIAGYTAGYFFKLILGQFNHITNAVQAEQIFVDFTANPYSSIAYHFLFIILTVAIVMGGISTGIEKWTKRMMPLLLFLLLVLAVRSVTLAGAARGLEFYLHPDFSKLSASTFAQALGQAFFSLSLGMGAMITYGSYMSRKDHMVSSAAYVCFFDTFIAILAGFVVFPALFAMGLNPAGGPGLVFIVLPSVFAKMPGGFLFGAGLFLLLALAALTSTISLLEVAVAYFIDERHWIRKRAALFVGLVAFIAGIPSALSFGANAWLSKLPIVHVGALELMNMLFGNYALALGSLFIAVFAGYKWGIRGVRSEVERQGNTFKLYLTWSFLIRFISPVGIVFILGYIVITVNYF